MKKLIISILGLGILGLANANEKIGDLKSSATMQATCSISANQISFGMVATPLMSQSANSEMSVKCSNASPYTIDLAYGGVYGTGTYSNYYISLGGYSSSSNFYMIQNKSGLSEGSISCGFGANNGKVIISNATIAKMYGYESIGSGWQNDTKGACVSNNTQNGTYPKGWIGAWNSPEKQSLGAKGYDYGVMKGSLKEDSLAYSIAVPGEPTKVWNAGNNSYKSSGNGDFQSIPIVAKIVPDKSASKYPAPDMYLDTVTAVISY